MLTIWPQFASLAHLVQSDEPRRLHAGGVQQRKSAATTIRNNLMKISAAILVGSLVSITAASVMGTPIAIAQWTFESSVPTNAGPYSPEIGSGTGTAFHNDGSTIYSSTTGDGSAISWNATRWTVGDYWQFSISTLGEESIVLTWAQASSNTGPGVFGLFYSTDGGSIFNQYSANYTVLANASPNPLWSSTTEHLQYSFTNNLSSIVNLNNASSVYFRLVDTNTTSANGGTVGTAGTDRVDNFTVTGTQIPDSTSGLVCLGGVLGLLEILRRIICGSSPLPQRHA